MYTSLPYIVLCILLCHHLLSFYHLHLWVCVYSMGSYVEKIVNISIYFHFNNPVSTYLMVHLLIVEPSSKDISSNLNFMWRGSPRWIMILSVLTSSWVAIKGIKTQNITLVILMIDDSTSSLSSLCLKQTVIVYKLSVLIKRWSSNFWKTWHGIMNYIDNWSAIEIFCYETWYLRYLLLLNS